MPSRLPPEIELLSDGTYRTRQTPLAARIFRWALIVAFTAAALAIAALALWFALVLIPVVIAAAVIAWLAFRYQVWRASRRRDIWRP